VEIFVLWPPALWILVVFLGLVVGSFLNVLAYRLPIMMEIGWRRQCAELAEQPSAVPEHAKEQPFNLWAPRSACPACGARVAAYHNVPIVSFLWLKGRCARCGARISSRYPTIEAGAALASLIVAYHFGPTWQTAMALPFTWALIALTVIDVEHQLLPDSITLPLLWAGLLISALPFEDAPPFADLQSSVIGAAAGYLSLWSVYQLFKLVTGKEGMGYGDFKLLGALGAWLGWQSLALVIVLAAGVGAVASALLLIASRKSRETPVPFGPYLAGAGWLALLWGENITDLYLRLFF
jgi:leader peptidase (prepilin peptidase) / N-methyltransferase